MYSDLQISQTQSRSTIQVEFTAKRDDSFWRIIYYIHLLAFIIY